MRVGIIRGDVPGPISLMDLEPVSRYNPSTEPRGQERRFDRPNSTIVGGAVAVIPAGLLGTVDISAGLVINAGNQVLKARISATAGFTTVTIAMAAYASGAALVSAVNTAIATAGLNATARLDDTGIYFVLQSNVPGVGSYIRVDSVAGGSTFNAGVGFNVLGDVFTVPTVAAIIAATLPVGGPLDVSTATLLTTVGDGATGAQLTALADTIAPQFIETDVAIKSFQVGMISGFRSALYNPDPNRIPSFPNGAAITVVQDDGVTPFVAPLTVITGAVHNVPNGGDITVTGTNLAHADAGVDNTIVKVTSANGTTSEKLYQYPIRTTSTGGTQGVVAPTSIVIPASLLNGLGVVGSKVIVQYTSFASNLFTVT